MAKIAYMPNKHSSANRINKTVKKLIPDYEIIDLNALEDLLLMMAKTVEHSLNQAGGVPGKDYTLLDCYKIAQPFALEVFKTNKGMTFDGGN